MRWLTPPRRPAGRGADEGAVAATVAVMLGVGVLLGMAAVVVDIGRLYAEREQLQSGADAAAWAVGEGCAVTPEGCARQAASAKRYADSNAADGTTAVTLICGAGSGLPACAAPAGNRTNCLGLPPATGRYAEVRVETRRPDGSTVLPPVFAGALRDRHAGTTVGGCARVAWGPPHMATGFAVTFSICEWRELTDGGLTFWPSPAAGVPPPSAERIVHLKGSTGASTCPAGPSGWDRPGGFGWLDDPSSSCAVTVETDGAFGGDTGNSASHPCRDAMRDAWQSHRVMLIPVYDGIRAQGSRIVYHLAGFASFVLTGYELSGFSSPSWLTGRQQCTGAQRCLYGYFVRGLLRTTGAQIGGPDLGTSVVNLIG